MKIGLIGSNINGNFTKMICGKFGLDNYDMFSMNKSGFEVFMSQRDFEKINITFPYKKDVMKYLDVIDPKAKEIGAVDTIIKKDGKLYGYNTDYEAFLYMINRHDIDFKGKKILILGNGGTSAAIQLIAKELEAREINVVDVKESTGAISYIDVFASHLDSEIVINASPVGMAPDIDNAPISMSLFLNCEAVIDVIYNPILTKLGFEAQELGIKRIIGMEMLVAQCKAAVELFTEQKFEKDFVDKIIHDTLIEQCNVVLIGMPSAGKTTIGKMLETRLGKPFIDLDDVVVEKAQMRIPEIFAKSGEAGFRKIESLTACELSKLNNKVIGTGGGTIKNKINMDNLRLNGITIFIDRDVDKLISSDPNRPLSSSREALKNLHDERLPLYQKYAAAVVLNNDDINDTVDQIVKQFHAIASQAVSYE